MKSAKTQAVIVAAMLVAAPLVAAAQQASDPQNGQWLPDGFDQLGEFSFANPLAKLAGAMITGGAFSLLAGQDETPLSS